YDNAAWEGKKIKGPEEKWISIQVNRQSLDQITEEQLQKLIADLEQTGYRTFLGMFGTGGAVGTGYKQFSYSPDTTVFDFDKSREEAAQSTATIVANSLSITPVSTRLIDVSPDPNLKYIVENSGLDLQLFISKPK